MNELQARVREIVKKIIENTEFKVVGVDLKSTPGRYMLRVFLDSEKGITIDRCREFSREIETVLDTENFLGENYLLEVSSPGLE
ncbi:MAG TPA: ribosome maturation factor RimP, partial [bacterium]|nr:ribosome maturation factor RimP [bacterium]